MTDDELSEMEAKHDHAMADKAMYKDEVTEMWLDGMSDAIVRLGRKVEALEDLLRRHGIYEGLRL